MTNEKRGLAFADEQTKEEVEQEKVNKHHMRKEDYKLANEETKEEVEEKVNKLKSIRGIEY